MLLFFDVVKVEEVFFNTSFLKLLLCIQTGWMKKFFLWMWSHIKSLHVLFSLSGLPRPHRYNPALSRFCFLALWNCLCPDRKPVLTLVGLLGEFFFPDISTAKFCFGFVNLLPFLLCRVRLFCSTMKSCEDHRRGKSKDSRCESRRHRWFCLLPAILKA